LRDQNCGHFLNVCQFCRRHRLRRELAFHASADADRPWNPVEPWPSGMSPNRSVASSELADDEWPAFVPYEAVEEEASSRPVEDADAGPLDGKTPAAALLTADHRPNTGHYNTPSVG